MNSIPLEWTRSATPRARVITAAGLLLGAIVAIGLVVRLVGFATAPMSPTEASLALSSYQLAFGQRPEAWTDPTQQTLTMALFFLFGTSDGIARVLTLVAGLAAIVMVWLLRPWLGATAADVLSADQPLERTPLSPDVTSGAIAAGLLALSALAVNASRHLGGESVAMALGLATVWIWLRLRNAPSTALVRLLAVVYAALLLAGAAGFQTGMILLGLALVATFRRPAGADGMTLRGLVSNRVATTLWLVPFLATLGVLSTCLLLYPGGVGLASVGAWGARFETDPQPASGLYPLFALLAYEPAILLLAIVGASLGLRRTRAETRGWVVFLVAWSVAEIGLAWLATTKTSSALTPALVPLALLGGIGGSVLIEQGRQAIARLNATADETTICDDLLPPGWRAVLIAVVPLLVAVGFAYTVLGFFTQPGGLFKEFGPPAILIAAILLGGMLWVAIQRLGRDSGSVLGLVAVAFALVASVHALSALNYGSRAELARPARPSAEIKLLADRIVDVADRLRGRQVTIAIDPQVRQPFAWYLRKLDNVRYSRTTQSGPTIVVLVDPAPPAGGQSTPFAGYQSHRARLFSPSTDGIESLTGWLRWWAFREGPAGTPTVVGYFQRQ